MQEIEAMNESRSKCQVFSLSPSLPLSLFLSLSFTYNILKSHSIISLKPVPIDLESFSNLPSQKLCRVSQTNI